MFCVCSATWACVQCKTLYDLEEIEQSLLDAVHRKSMAYVLQDLECEKCHGVSQLISVFIEQEKILSSDSRDCYHSPIIQSSIISLDHLDQFILKAFIFILLINRNYCCLTV